MVEAAIARLLSAEQSGTSPRTIGDKWLLLASRTWSKSRWQVTFNVPDTIYHILDDPDVRAKDIRYAENQWAQAREWLNG
ncbi:hypothetical protein EAH79_15225 [Sphingomonas koreensis]|nr:hypothetical protein EAH79_15225 [Sphingomonas koreensis]